MLAPYDRDQALSFVVLGASGDLAMKKIFPALFALYCQELLPHRFHIAGFSRSTFTNEAFRERISEHLTCRYVPGERCSDHMKTFLNACTYVSGNYDSPEAYLRLHQELAHVDDGNENRIFYMSIPPFLFLQVAHALADAGHVHRQEKGGWSRVVIEKPFGSDRASSDKLADSMGQVFSEDQTFRIDHYLGKEVIQNLMVLRFANLIFDPLWNRNHIQSVRISWSEEIGLEGRAGYFDRYGIIRDVMQNHLLQMLALLAMEQPVRLESHFVRDEKVKALRSIPPVKLEDLVVGQYAGGTFKGREHKGYLDEDGISSDSLTPTFAAAVLQVRNRRWDGVPFFVRAGKALSGRTTEMAIRFREVPGNIFGESVGHLASNELRIRIQPDAGISLRIISKVPGLRIALDESDLDLSYAAAFRDKIPDAYETLLLDVIRGDRSLFIRGDELQAAWDVFTPVLHELEQKNIRPRSYAFGSTGPAAAEALATRHGIHL
jgi:glucose-6-phosphate 1-dehydrogenase